MSDPLPAVTEAEASGEIADIFADIRQVYRVSVVNLIWRHLATLPGALPWVWESVRPLYIDGSLEHEAAALRASVALQELPEFPPAVLTAIGLGRRDLEQIRSILAAYNRTNALALIALSAAIGKITGARTESDSAVAQYNAMPASSRTELQLPPLLSLEEMSSETAKLVMTMNRLGAKPGDSVLASMYRHLAHWPAYLALAWTMIAPLDADSRLDHAIADALTRARASGRRLVARLSTPSRTLVTPVRADISRALDDFTRDVIARMVVIGALLRRATGENSMENS
jgi:hypothetical protein